MSLAPRRGAAVITDVEIECTRRMFGALSVSPVWLARDTNVKTGAASIGTSTITDATYRPDALRMGRQREPQQGGERRSLP